MAIQAPAIVGKRFRKIHKDTDAKRVDQWIRTCGDVALNNQTIDVSPEDNPFGKQQAAKVFTLDKYYFATIFVDSQQAVTMDNVIDGFIHSNLDMLCVINTSGRFIKVNKAFENILGISSDELEQRNILSYIHVDDMVETMDVLKRLIEKPIINYLTTV